MARLILRASNLGFNDFLNNVNTEAQMAAAEIPAVGQVVRYIDTSGTPREVRCYEVVAYVAQSDVAGEGIRSTSDATKYLARIYQG